jgi:hypothetical protein
MDSSLVQNHALAYANRMLLVNLMNENFGWREEGTKNKDHAVAVVGHKVAQNYIH